MSGGLPELAARESEDVSAEADAAETLFAGPRACAGRASQEALLADVQLPMLVNPDHFFNDDPLRASGEGNRMVGIHRIHTVEEVEGFEAQRSVVDRVVDRPPCCVNIVPQARVGYKVKEWMRGFWNCPDRLNDDGNAVPGCYVFPLPTVRPVGQGRTQCNLHLEVVFPGRMVSTMQSCRWPGIVLDEGGGEGHVHRSDQESGGDQESGALVSHAGTADLVGGRRSRHSVGERGRSSVREQYSVLG